MKRICSLMFAAAMAAYAVAWASLAAGQTGKPEAPIFGVQIPDGYRQWELVAVTHATHPGIADEVKGILGNAAAVKADQEGALPFPDGTVLAKLTWQHVPLGPFDGVFVPGAPVRLEFMVKDSQKY